MGGQSLPAVSYCQLNMSQCDATENNDQFVVNVYNSMAKNVDKYVRVPVTIKNLSYKILDAQGKINFENSYQPLIN